MSYYSDYKSGNYQEVWRKIVLSEIVNDDVMSVADLMIERVALNTETLIQRLNEIGYQFGYYPDGEEREYFIGAHVKPDHSLSSYIDELETYIEVPILLKKFWSTVGEVDLIGRHPEWDYEYLDPYVVHRSPVEVVLDDYESWQMDLVEFTQEELEEGFENIPFGIVIAPDFYHKDNVSGGPPYGIAVGDGINPEVINEPNDASFVQYLRLVFKWGGFPGFQNILDKPDLRYLTDSLLPI